MKVVGLHTDWLAYRRDAVYIPSVYKAVWSRAHKEPRWNTLDTVSPEAYDGKQLSMSSQEATKMAQQWAAANGLMYLESVGHKVPITVPTYLVDQLRSSERQTTFLYWLKAAAVSHKAIKEVVPKRRRRRKRAPTPV